MSKKISYLKKEIIKINENCKNSKKGFTLVELIVVLVILAILAAVAVPFMLGFTDNAREKQYIADAKEALTASQAMLSDAYNDNLKFISKDMRDQAFETSGLAGNVPGGTEFTIWTAASFKAADGTAKTTKSYTVATAIYKVNNNTYVYFDGKDWKVFDTPKGLAGVSAYNETDGSMTYTGNYIVVWPYNSAKTDTASVDATASADDKYSDDNNDRDANAEAEQKIKTGVTLKFTAPKAIKNHIPLYLDKKSATTLSASYTYSQLTPNINTETDTVYFNDDLEWSWTNRALSNNDVDRTGKGSLNELMAYLNRLYGDGTGVTERVNIIVTGSITEKEIHVPVKFEAYEDSGVSRLTVTDLNPKAKDSDGNDKSYPEIVYKMASEKIEDSSFNMSEVKVESNSQNKNIRFDRSHGWVVGFARDNNDDFLRNDDNSDYEFVADSEVKSFAESTIKSYIENSIDNNNLEADKSALETRGIEFVASADIYKKVKVKNVDDTNIKVLFGSNHEESFSEIYSYNEFSKNIYSTTGDGINATKESVICSGNELVDDYSIFTDHPMTITKSETEFSPYAESGMRVKYWYLYESDFECSEKNNPDKNREQPDCTKEIIDKLYADKDNNFGEVAEIDISRYTSNIAKEYTDPTNVIDDTGTTQIRNCLTQIADNSASKILTIEYITKAEWQALYNSNSIHKEVCISDTKVEKAANIKLAKNEDGYVVSERDSTYPGYTVALSVKNGTNYNIKILTEDDSVIKVDGSLSGMNKDFKVLTSNTMVNHFDTSKDEGIKESTGITNMSRIFSGCEKLNEINLSNFDTSNVTDMSAAFYNCKAAKSIDVSSFNTINVTDMSYMFFDCSNLQELNLKNFDSAKVTTMKSMFNNCSGLTNIKLDPYSFTAADKLETVESMFENCKKLEGIDLRGFSDCVNLCSIKHWFYNCFHLKWIDLANFSTGTSAQTRLADISGSFWYVGKYNGNTSDSWNNDGCSIFAKGKWECTENVIVLESNAKDDYNNFAPFFWVRIYLYGSDKMNDKYKTFNDFNKTNQIMNPADHLTVANNPMNPANPNNKDVGNGDYFKDGNYRRAKTGYFMFADPTSGSYYDTWKSNNPDYQQAGN